MESVVRQHSAAPVFDGEGARGWAASEIAALDTVRIAGKTDVERRALAVKLQAARKAVKQR